MASSDAFSTVANAFSVVGLADIVFKYGREVCETLVRIYNAPKEIKELLGEVKDVEEHVARTSIFLADFEQSTLSKSNKQIIPAIKALLARCQNEFDYILKSAKETTGTATDGWFGRFSKSTRWVWNEQDIALSRRRLARLRGELDSALTLAGRESDIAIHTEMTNVHADVTQMSANSNAAFADVNTATSMISSKVHSVSTDICTFHRENTTQLGDINTTIAEARNETKAGSAEIGRQLNIALGNSQIHFSTLRKEIKGGNHSVRKDLKVMSKSIKTSTRQYARHQDSANARLMAKLEEMKTTFTENLATISLTQTEDAFAFEGSNLESATLPLSLLHSELLKALPALKSERNIEVSQDEAFWIQQQFDRVLGASHEVSAKAARLRATGRQVNAMGLTHPQRQQKVANPAFGQLAASRGDSASESPQVQKAAAVKYSIVSHDTPLGALNFMVTHSKNCDEVSGRTQKCFHSITISFFPNTQFRLPGITASFTKSHQFDRQSVPSSIRLWNVVPESSPAFGAAAENNVKELRRLFDAGLASPFDQTPDGYSLAAEAMKHMSYDTFELLLQQGVGLPELQSVYGLYCPPDLNDPYLYYDNDHSTVFRMLSLIALHEPDFFFCFNFNVVVLRCLCSLILQSSKKVVGRGILDAATSSPLEPILEFARDHASLESTGRIMSSSYAVIIFSECLERQPASELIIRFYKFLTARMGSLTSTDADGRNILHFLCFVTADLEIYKVEKIIPYVSELLKMGIPVNLLDKGGYTPTDVALEANTRVLLAWVGAVQQAGSRLDEVHCGDGTTLEDILEDLRETPRYIPHDPKFLRECGMDELGLWAEVILMDSHTLREAWFEGVDHDDLFLLGVSDLWS